MIVIRFLKFEKIWILEIHTPEGGVEHYAYDCAGNITGTTDANGNTITYRYNSFGQACEIRDSEGHSEYFYCDEEGRQEMHIDRNGNTEHTRLQHGRQPVRYGRQAGRSALLYSNRRVEGTEQKEQTGRKSQAAPEMYGSSVLSSSTAMTEKICVMRRKKTGKSSAFSSTGANWAESFFLCSGRDGKRPVPAG